MSHYKGSSRVYRFSVYTKLSEDSEWTKVGTKNSPGDTNELYIYDVINSVARYILIESNGNSSNEWSDISELEIYGTIGEEVNSEECIAAAPENRKAEILTTSSVKLSWNDIANIDHYNVRYKKVDENYWAYVYSIKTNSTTIEGLTKTEDYEWQIRAKCVNGDASEYTSAKSYFTTSNLGNTAIEEEETEYDSGFGPASVSVGTITWRNWYLSVPVERTDGSGKATSIYFEDIEAGNLSNEKSDYFEENSDGSYKMNTQFTGYTTSGYYETSNKKYCRTELREYWQGNQTTSDNWYMDNGVHELETTLSVNKCEGEAQTYVAQIHGIKGTSLSGGELTASPATVKLRWDDDQIVLEYYTTGGISDGEWTSSSGVEKPVIGEVGNNKFTLRVKIDDGALPYT